MSVKMIDWVFENSTEINQTEKLVMLALANFADNNGVCFPSNTTIARYANLETNRSIQKVLHNLEEGGHIWRFEQFRDNRQKGYS